MANAAGLTWMDERTLLFSRVKTGLHMGWCSRTKFLEPSPDLLPRTRAAYGPLSTLLRTGSGRWWWRWSRDGCLAASYPWMELAGPASGPGWEITAAAWSPDGTWMYFGAAFSGARHLWRQRFPTGEPEQITFGPAEEEGLAIAPDGRSLITSVGLRESSVWIHDSKASAPSRGRVRVNKLFTALAAPFSRNGRRLYYLLQRKSPGFRQRTVAS